MLHKVLISIVLIMNSWALTATEYHVSVSGHDSNIGTIEKPLKTIGAAARIAKPGDIVTVHAGTYRELINPINGGTNDLNRITYQAAQGENVFIKGSEIINNWEKVTQNVWKVELPNSYFGKYNPYLDTIAGDWFSSNGRKHHTGEVYLNSKSLYEVENLDKVKNPVYLKDTKDLNGSLYTWYCENNETVTTIWANFNGENPNKELVEINVRPACFFPEKTGVNYITVRGFKLSQAATQWSPPTAHQTGLIGPNWSKGWIIENNTISDSKCAGISLGKEGSTGNNFDKLKMKSGFQNQLEVVFKAYHAGWSKEMIGSHIVRNNEIYNCEQTGIVGHLGAIYSQIYNNHIHHIYTKRQFGGAEIAGIKLHAPIDVTIRHNRINNCDRGIWMDWQAQGLRITGNLLYNNKLDLFVEVSHGPYMVDNNIMLSPLSLRLYSEGGAFAHNLLTGTIFIRNEKERYTPFHYPHSTKIAGTAIIEKGDDRYYNNVFATIKSQVIDSTKFGVYGLLCYNENPPSYQKYIDKLPMDSRKVPIYNNAPQPVWIASNLYYNGSKPYIHETDFIEVNNADAGVKIEERGNEVFIHLNVDESYLKVKTQLVNTALLGTPRISEAPFENVDGALLTIDSDFFDKKRPEILPRVGPIENLKTGTQILKVW